MLSAAPLLAAHLILNEILIRPPAGGSEWVEILNAGDEPAPLAGVALVDSRGRPARLSADAPPLPPGGFRILAADVAKFLEAWPDADAASVTKPEGTWPTLNDSDGSEGFADRVVIRDASGAIVDSLVYTERWVPKAGVSIERVDPAGLTNLASNWSPSTDGRGATPLRRNSLALAPDESLQGALILPAGPLEDSGDGLQVPIAWHVDRPARLSLELFDMTGRSVRLLKPLEESGTVGRVVWDGRDDGGRAVPAGIYWVLLEGRLDGDVAASRWRRPVAVAR